MNTFTKIVLSSILFMTFLLGASLYFVSQKINPEMVKNLIIENLENKMHQVDVRIGSVDYNLGAIINIDINELMIESTESKKPFLKIAQIKVKVPLLAILTSGGAINIESHSPQIFISKDNGELNWVKALESKKDKSHQKEKKDEKLEFPSFVNKSKVNFRLHNALLLLRLDDQQKAKYQIKRLVLKNINLKKTTAFELSSEIMFNISEDEVIDSNIQIIGEVSLPDYLGSQEINTSFQYKVSDTSLPGFADKLPVLKGMVKTRGRREKLQLNIQGELDTLLEYNADMLYENNRLTFDNLNLKASNKNIAKLFLKNANLDRLVDYNRSETTINGNLSIELEQMAINPNLSFLVSKPIVLNLGDQKATTEFSGTLISRDFNLNSTTLAYSGKITTDIKTKINYDDPSHLEAIYIDSKLVGLKLGKDKIQDYLWGEKNEKANPKPSAPVNKPPEEPLKLPMMKINLDGEQVFVADQEISFKFNMNIKDNKLTSSENTMKYGAGHIEPNFTLDFSQAEIYKSNYKLNFKNVEVMGFNAFFPPFLKELRGKFNGLLTGDITSDHGVKKYHTKASLSGQDGDLDKLNISAILKPIIENIELLKNNLPENQNVSTQFTKMDLIFKANNQWIDLEKLDVVGHKQTSRLRCRGKISLHEQISKLTGRIYSQANAARVKKLTGETDIPFRVTGAGFAIYNPDIGYTANKITQMVGKNIKKNIDSKVKQKVQQLKKDIEPKLENEFKKQKKKLEEKLKGIKL